MASPTTTAVSGRKMEVVLQSQMRFKRKEFWQEVYSTRSLSSLHDWYGKAHDYRSIWKNADIREADRAIVLGSAVQDIVEYLHEDAQIKNIECLADVECVNNGKERHSKRASITWIPLDPKSFEAPFAASSTAADLICDCGHFDMLCGTSTSDALAQQYLEKALASLKSQTGKLVIFTLAQERSVAALVSQAIAPDLLAAAILFTKQGE